MLDYHFPLMKYAFYSKEYHPVILENEEGIVDIGLKYVNNDMCYPAICNAGQIIGALQSGKYDLSRTKVLMATAGDACRGSNYITTLKRALKKANFEHIPMDISDDFATIPMLENRKQRIGIVGEIYHKYSHLGNWDLPAYLEENNCESHTNGVSWYMMYYVDTHLLAEKTILHPIYKLAQNFFGHLQKSMISAIRKNGFYSMDDFFTMKEQVKPYISMGYCIGDGWLVGAECAGHILEGCPKVMAVQSFGCMPMQTCGKGMYTKIGRDLAGKGFISCSEIDHSGSKLNYYNRVQMLISI